MKQSVFRTKTFKDKGFASKSIGFRSYLNQHLTDKTDN